MGELIRDLDWGHGNNSLLRYFTSRALTEIDWQIVDVLGDRPERLPALIKELDIVRQVAVVHAMFAVANSYQDDRQDEREWYLKHVKLRADLVLRIAETWEEVENAKERWRALGLTITGSEVRGLAEFAERALQTEATQT
jgi:hypothetical protein